MPAVFSESGLDEFSDRLYHMSDLHLLKLRDKSPQLVGDSVHNQATVLHGLNLLGGCWEKRLFNMCCICTALENEHALRDVLLGTHFTVWGWVDDQCNAHLLDLGKVIQGTQTQGILEIAHKHCLGMAKHKTTALSIQTLWLRVHEAERREEMPRCDTVDNHEPAKGAAPRAG